MKLAHAVTALGLASVALLVACGDDEKQPLSKSEYVKQGNAICATSQKQFNQLFETEFPTTPAALPGFFGKATPIFEQQMSDLRALDGPDADQAKVDRMLATGDKAVADYERATKDEKLGGKLFAEEGGKNQAAFDKQATAVGLKCDEDEETPAKKLDPKTFSPDKRAYVAKIDAVCRANEKKFSALEGRYLQSFPPELEVWAKFLPAIVEVGRAGSAEIEKIEPPAADKAKIDALNARQEALLERFSRAGEAAADNDEKSFQSLSSAMFADGDELDEDLRAYGFQVCGSEEEEG